MPRCNCNFHQAVRRDRKRAKQGKRIGVEERYLRLLAWRMVQRHG